MFRSRASDGDTSFSVSVARSIGSVLKLCTGSPCGFRSLAAFASLLSDVMLVPRLLAILLDDRRRTRLEGEWPFPGLIPGRHLGKDAVELVCREALELAGIDKPIRTLSRPKVA